MGQYSYMGDSTPIYPQRFKRQLWILVTVSEKLHPAKNLNSAGVQNPTSAWSSGHGTSNSGGQYWPLSIQEPQPLWRRKKPLLLFTRGIFLGAFIPVLNVPCDVRFSNFIFGHNRSVNLATIDATLRSWSILDCSNKQQSYQWSRPKV
jgi:hypothetical protein